MWLIYYVKDGIKGWMLSKDEETLQKWADENLDGHSGDDEYEIVDLARRDLASKLHKANKKLEIINNILNNNSI